MKILKKYFNSISETELEYYLSNFSDLFKKIGYTVWFIITVSLTLNRIIYTMNFLWLLFFPVSLFFGFFGFVMVCGIDSLHETLYRHLYKKYKDE